MTDEKTFLLIETAVGCKEEVWDALTQCPHVSSADWVTGPYDIVAVVKQEDAQAIRQRLSGLALARGGLIRIVTCPIARQAT